MATTTRPIKIGMTPNTILFNKKGIATPLLFSYSLLQTTYPRDWDGWVDISYALPLPFDLVLMATDELKIVSGWWDGREWEGLRLKKKDKVKAWKYKESN